MKTIHIRNILLTELEWVNAQYAAIDFAPSSTDDFMVVAEIDGVKAGIGRLVQVADEAAELGGIYVLPEFRGHSVATQIVEYLVQHSAYPKLFCVPFVHLTEFYQRFEFVPLESDAAVPEKIAKKINWCAKTYASPVVGLYRLANNG